MPNNKIKSIRRWLREKTTAEPATVAEIEQPSTPTEDTGSTQSSPRETDERSHSMPNLRRQRSLSQLPVKMMRRWKSRPPTTFETLAGQTISDTQNDNIIFLPQWSGNDSNELLKQEREKIQTLITVELGHYFDRHLDGTSKEVVHSNKINSIAFDLQASLRATLHSILKRENSVNLIIHHASFAEKSDIKYSDFQTTSWYEKHQTLIEPTLAAPDARYSPELLLIFSVQTESSTKFLLRATVSFLSKSSITEIKSIIPLEELDEMPKEEPSTTSPWATKLRRMFSPAKTR